MADIDTQDLYFNPSYYFIGQFSKFVPPKSIKIGLQKTIRTPLFGSPPFLHGGDIIAEICTGGSSQLWDFSPNATDKLILSKQIPDICIMVPPPSLTGANIFLSFTYDTPSCNPTRLSQLFSWLPDGHIISKQTGLCLDVEIVDSTKNQGYDFIVSEKCENKPSQIWINEQGKIRNVALDRCMDAGGTYIHATAFKTPDGEIVTVVENISDNNWEFKLKYKNNATKVLAPAHSIQTLKWESF
eukprot:TRINITY_DN9424_c0_g1_i2.p1 TRINITY_DN9424_c0_g1~~TRINITY_DN9424_c0_g1_i2.p1  ORF type:complete len:242 (-),score=35.57 TRINITY_DN9424_c0_g1_i2:24-749(-)